jgi:hypothetical protein
MGVRFAERARSARQRPGHAPDRTSPASLAGLRAGVSNHLLARALLQRQAAAPAIELDIDRLLREQSHLVIGQIMPDVFLAITHRELSTNLPSGTAKYEPGEPVRIEYSGRESVVEYHCTDLVMNSAYLAGYEVPTGSYGFWLPSERTLERARRSREGDVIKQVPTPADRPETPEDESKANVRPGDVLVYGPESSDVYGHQAVIAERGATAGEVIVHEAGAEVAFSKRRKLAPSDREAAVYRFTKVDAQRVKNNYENDAEYRRLFNNAFERHYHSGYRIDLVGPPSRYYLPPAAIRRPATAP